MQSSSGHQISCVDDEENDLDYMITSYIYVSLKESRQIRLVHLRPGFWDDPIRCGISVASLDEIKTPFEALSYFWGDQEGKQEISLNGETFDVTANLISALRHLRTFKKTRVLWIDALCINQKDRAEKAVQVNMMGDIYKACKKGILWVGEETQEADEWCRYEDQEICKSMKSEIEAGDEVYVDNYGRKRATQKTPVCRWHGRQPKMSEAFKLLETLADGCHLHEIPGFVYHASPENDEQRRFVEPIQALWALMRRPWWGRIWTVQETVLPIEAILVCGALEIPWHTVVKAAFQLQQPHPGSSVFKEALTGRLFYSTHGRQTSDILERFSRNIITLEEVRVRVLSQSDLGFLNLFRWFSHRRATDDRDKIYGLLGLLGKDERLIGANYELNTEELNRKLSRCILLSSKHQHSRFSIMERGNMDTSRNGLPSWANDFSRTLNHFEQSTEGKRARNRRSYNASGKRLGEVFSHGEMVISLNCAWVDEIEKITETACSRIAEESVRKFLLDQCASLIDYGSCKDEEYPTCHDTARDRFLDKREAFYRTIFGDRRASDEPDRKLQHPNTRDIENLKNWVFFWPEIELRGDIRSRLLSDIGFHVYNRKFFITRDGLFGLGPPNMKKGDAVWIPGGSRVPFVFRELPGSQPKEEGYFQQSVHYQAARGWRAVVGDCYVHGVMEGETEPLRNILVFLK